MKRILLPALSIFFGLGLSACGGSSTGPADDPGNGGNPRVIVADPSFATVIQEIFTRKGCTASSCHGSSAQEGLDLRAGNSYGNLVSVASNQSGAFRVIPGNANGSYIIVKVEGRQSVGTRMPQTGSNLDNIDLTNLKNWINQGAKNN
jgi:hypothetical protein